jgi:tetratricopeptide (TPR) repeat protein
MVEMVFHRRLELFFKYLIVFAVRACGRFSGVFKGGLVLLVSFLLFLSNSWLEAYAEKQELWSRSLRPDSAVKSASYSEASVLAKALELQKKGAHASTVNLLEQLLRRNSKQPEAWYICAQSLGSLGKKEKAYNYLGEALKLRPNFAEALRLRICLADDSPACLKTTFADYTHLEKIAPNDGWLFANRAITFARMGEHRKALQDYRRAIALGGGGNLPLCYQGEAVCYRIFKEPKKALVSISEAIRLSPGDDSFYNNRGNIYCDLKDYSRAIVDFDKAIALNPRRWKSGEGSTLRNRGKAYHDIGRHDKAILDFNLAIENVPEDPGLYILRSTCYCDLGKYNLAIDDASKALELDSNSVEAYRSRYCASSKAGDLEQALADFNTIALLTPGKKTGTPGQVRMTSGNWQEIIRAYSKVIELNPRASDSYFDRGLAYFCLNKWQLATSDFRKVLNLSHYTGGTSTSAILLNYIALMQQGANSEARDLLFVLSKQNKNLDWPYPILCYYRRQINEKQLIDSAQGNKFKLTGVNCYLGIDMLLSGNKKKALEYLERVKTQGSLEADEYAVALAFLSDLQGGRKRPNLR